MAIDQKWWYWSAIAVAWLSDRGHRKKKDIRSIMWVYVTIPTCQWIGLRENLQDTKVFTIKYGHWIIDWWFQPLWKMMEFVSWDDDIPNIWKVQTTNQWLYNLLFWNNKIWWFPQFHTIRLLISNLAMAKINRVGKWWSHRTQSIRAAFNRYRGETWAKCSANFTTFPTWKAIIYRPLT